ncbi:hypothetical protein LAZ67_13001152 [Cordylochernes scorpioides]|uniref:Uncharacterized protein n=1 Tax=Cordylochernes scorpioides TaxID=51811 RepID=A0ABY6L7J4_9ARAC|nr:hypothetical protein LAZ67_13001152 [Cordylochernes scorpioides]
MQDGGPPHISHGAKQLLKDTFRKDSVISCHFIHQWPPGSPNLTPCDLWLWDYIKFRANWPIKCGLLALLWLQNANWWQGILVSGSGGVIAGVEEAGETLGTAVDALGSALVGNEGAGADFMAAFTAVEALRSSGAVGRVVTEATTGEADSGADGLLEVEDYSIHNDPLAIAQGSEGLEVHFDEGGAGPVSGCRTVRHAHHLVPRELADSRGFQERLFNGGVGCFLIHFEKADARQDLLLLANLHAIQLVGQGGGNSWDGIGVAGVEDKLTFGSQGGPNALG